MPQPVDAHFVRETTLRAGGLLALTAFLAWASHLLGRLTSGAVLAELVSIGGSTALASDSATSQTGALHAGAAGVQGAADRWPAAGVVIVGIVSITVVIIVTLLAVRATMRGEG